MYNNQQFNAPQEDFHQFGSPDRFNQMPVNQQEFAQQDIEQSFMGANGFNNGNNGNDLI